METKGTGLGTRQGKQHDHGLELQPSMSHLDNIIFYMANKKLGKRNPTIPIIFILEGDVIGSMLIN